MMAPSFGFPGVTPTETPLTTLIKEMREAADKFDALNLKPHLYINSCNPENMKRVLDACDEMRVFIQDVESQYNSRISEEARAVLAKHFGEGK